MSIAPYMLWVNSNPTQVSYEAWKQWYTSERIPDNVNSGNFIKAVCYEEIELPGFGAPGDSRKFLVLYETIHRNPSTPELMARMPLSSDNLPKMGTDANNVYLNGDWDGRCYELVQNYNPNNIGDGMLDV
jgi:hypothetical protein